MDAAFVVEFVDKDEGVIGEGEVFIRANLPRLLDSVRTRIMHDDDLLEDCRGLHIRRID